MSRRRRCPETQVVKANVEDMLKYSDHPAELKEGLSEQSALPVDSFCTPLLPSTQKL